MNRRLLVVGLLLGLSAAASGCGGEAKTETPAEGDVTVAMKGLQFSPAELTVKKGVRITFVNQDAMVHDVVQSTVRGLGKETPEFNSGVLKPGESWTVTIEDPGAYPILCSQMGHYTAGMVGTITVVE